jgi:threonyl-tRNA synthetase
VQIAVLPISEKYYDYSLDICNKLKRNGFRVEIDNRIESLNKKIRQAELKKIPYMLIIGEKEVSCNSVTIRKKTGEDLKDINISSFIDILNENINKKKTKP